MNNLLEYIVRMFLWDGKSTFPIRVYYSRYHKFYYTWRDDEKDAQLSGYELYQKIHTKMPMIARIADLDKYEDKAFGLVYGWNEEEQRYVFETGIYTTVL